MATPRVIVKRTALLANSAAPANAAEPASTSDKKAGGLKVIVRRLPPAMSKDEFETWLPPEFQEGNGKVDWFHYNAGKVTTNAAKNSHPSCAYLHLINADDVVALSKAVQKAALEDAKGSWNDPSLVGAPIVEKALNKRVPKAKERVDSRQGTIDQDPEFQEFLRSLTEPPTKAANEENGDTDEDKIKRMTTTPLIEFLQEERRKLEEMQTRIMATEAKAAAAALVKEEAKKKEREKDKLKKGGGSVSAPSAAKVEGEASELPAPSQRAQPRRRLTPGTVRLLRCNLEIFGGARRREHQQDTKADNPAEGAPGAKGEMTRESKEVKINEDARVETEGKAKDKDAAGPSASAADRNRAPTPTSSRTRTRGGRGRNSEKSKAPIEPRAPFVLLLKRPENADPRQEANMATASQEADTASQPSASQVSASQDSPLRSSASQPSTLQSSSSTAQVPKKTQTEKAATPTSGTGKGSSRKDKKPAVPASISIAPGATEGFIKNIRGVTEDLLKAKLEEFGKVVSIDIRKGKWHAFIEFGEHDGLVRAAVAPISIGETTFQVVEKREKEKPAPAPAPAKDEAPITTAEAIKANELSRRSGRGRRGRGGGGKAGASSVSEEASGDKGGKGD